MNIIGLENNYYLTYNDIWIRVNGFSEQVSYLELKVRNANTAKELQPLRLYPSPSNDFVFNICLPVRALMPVPDHININSLQTYEFTFDVKFGNSTLPNETLNISKYFVRGGRNKNANKEWFLHPSEELIIGRWIEWIGVTFPGYAKRIQGSTIVDFIPSNIYRKSLSNICDYKILKFQNSIGGFQYFLFEKWEIKPKTKVGKSIGIINSRLREDNFKVVENSTERIIEFQTKTPIEIQEVFTELTTALDVFLFNPLGDDENAKWQRLKPENNEAIENNFDRVFENKISFSFQNNLTKGI